MHRPFWQRGHCVRTVGECVSCSLVVGGSADVVSSSESLVVFVGDGGCVGDGSTVSESLPVGDPNVADSLPDSDGDVDGVGDMDRVSVSVSWMEYEPVGFRVTVVYEIVNVSRPSDGVGRVSVGVRDRVGGGVTVTLFVRDAVGAVVMVGVSVIGSVFVRVAVGGIVGVLAPTAPPTVASNVSAIVAATTADGKGWRRSILTARTTTTLT